MNRRNRKQTRRHPVLLTIAAFAALFYVLQLHVTATVGSTQISISMMLIVSLIIVLAFITGLALIVRNLVVNGAGVRIDRPEATA